MIHLVGLSEGREVALEVCQGAVPARIIRQPDHVERHAPATDPLTWEPTATGLVVHVPELLTSKLPRRNAWVFKLAGLKEPKVGD